MKDISTSEVDQFFQRLFHRPGPVRVGQEDGRWSVSALGLRFGSPRRKHPHLPESLPRMCRELDPGFERSQPIEGALNALALIKRSLAGPGFDSSEQQRPTLFFTL